MVIELTSKEFSQKVDLEEKPVVVDFSADSWCAPCKVLSPIYEEFSKEIKKAKFYKVDADKEPELTRKFNIMSVPTIIIFKKGKEIARINGYPGKEQLRERILSKI
ncbi:MAG: thioredoxin [Nanoarchaeota archaeon]